MGKLLEFIKNKEHLKLSIIDYVDSNINIIHFSDEYWIKHWEIFKETEISKREFEEKLYNYLWIPKVSELLIILYLEDLKNINPNFYEMNKLLRRTKEQYSATLKSIQKLEKLDIIYTKSVEDSKRNEKQIFINKKITRIYGEDEFRQMMLEEWETDAKEYTKRKINSLLKEKEKVEYKIKMNKKGKRVKKYGFY
jgi:hypothetical protein